jgi:hypothetical protein
MANLTDRRSQIVSVRTPEEKMETVKLAANHLGCEFEVDAVFVGKLCVHLEPNEGVEYKVSHAATLFAMPGSYLSQDDAMAAAREIDAMLDWDAIVSAISPVDASPEERMAYADLGNAVWEIACKHGSLPR